MARSSCGIYLPTLVLISYAMVVPARPVGGIRSRSQFCFPLPRCHWLSWWREGGAGGPCGQVGRGLRMVIGDFNVCLSLSVSLVNSMHIYGSHLPCDTLSTSLCLSVFLHPLSRGTSAGAGAELPSLSTSPPRSHLATALGSSPPSSTNSFLRHGSASPPPPTPMYPSLAPLSRPPPAPSRLRTFHGHGGPVWTVGCDGGGGWMASGSYDKCIKVRNSAPACVKRLCLLFVHLLSAQVWDTASQQCQRTLRGHDGWVSSLAVLRRGDMIDMGDGSPRVVSASYDTTIKVWNPAAGDLLASMSAGALQWHRKPSLCKVSLN